MGTEFSQYEDNVDITLSKRKLAASQRALELEEEALKAEAAAGKSGSSRQPSKNHLADYYKHMQGGYADDHRSDDDDFRDEFDYDEPEDEMSFGRRRGGGRSNKKTTSKPSSTRDEFERDEFEKDEFLDDAYGNKKVTPSKSPANNALKSPGNKKSPFSPSNVKSPNSKQASTSSFVAKKNVNNEDVMRYLKAVASHSSDLPLTRRDDPELGRTISSLSADDYATKADAFIPSDVRVIAASSSHRNSRHSVAPSRKNFRLYSKAKEPGLTSGGACCNSLLKILYDTDNEAVDALAMNNFETSDNFFDDDDEAAFDDGGSVGSFGSIDFGTLSNSDVTWATMMQRMKKEMSSKGYKQTPFLSTSRRFDLNSSVRLVSEKFDSRRNKKLALLIGCNYSNDQGALKSCHYDISSVKDYLINVHAFSDTKENMIILLDDNVYAPPTFKNITDAMTDIASRSKPGDAIFVQFSGHGGRVADKSSDAEEGCYDEVIVPQDYKKGGFISDSDIFKSLLIPMAADCTVTILLDSCDSGVVFDLPYSWSIAEDRNGANSRLALNDDFSFMRFLKVAKNVYENKSIAPTGADLDRDIRDAELEDDNDDDSLCTDDGNNYDDNDVQHKTSLMESFSSSCDGVTDVVKKIMNIPFMNNDNNQDEQHTEKIMGMRSYDDDDESDDWGTKPLRSRRRR